MLIFYLIVLLLPFLAVRKRAEGSEIMDSKSTTCLKGVLCLYVLLHNLGLDYKGNSAAMELICEHTGGVGVGVFFFLSAFGIIRSYQKNGNKYLPKLLLQNVIKLYLVSVLINVVTYFMFFKGNFETGDLLLRIFNLDVFNNFNRMNRHGWYISTIIAMYIIFALVYYICSKLKTEKRFVIACFILAFIAIGFRLTARIADTGGMYTRELPCFAIGCLYATFYDKVNYLFNRYFLLSLLSLIASFILGFIFFEPVAAYAACLIIICLSQKITYYSKPTFFLGKICLGVYLTLHFSSIIMQPFITNQYLWVITNSGLILLLSLAIHGLVYGVDYVIKLIKKECEKRKSKTRQVIEINEKDSQIV